MKTFKIIVNGRKLSIDKEYLSYDDIVSLGHDKPRSALHSIVYQGPRNGDCRRSGMIIPGQVLKIEDGMVISAMVTDNA